MLIAYQRIGEVQTNAQVALNNGRSWTSAKRPLDYEFVSMTLNFTDGNKRTETFKLGNIGYGNEQEKHTVKNLSVSGESSGTLQYHLASGANVTTANLTSRITMEFHSEKDTSTIGTINHKGEKLVLANNNQGHS